MLKQVQHDAWSVGGRRVSPFLKTIPRIALRRPRPYSAAMQRLDSGSPMPADLCGAIVALGNFDGFHLGHQAVVARAVERARAEGRP